jgi:hypothetical protein
LREAEDLSERYRSSTDKAAQLGFARQDDEPLDHSASIHHEPLVFGWPIRGRWPAISSFAEALFFAKRPGISGI